MPPEVCAAGHMLDQRPEEECTAPPENGTWVKPSWDLGEAVVAHGELPVPKHTLVEVCDGGGGLSRTNMLG